jgi:hypothetical protein
VRCTPAIVLATLGVALLPTAATAATANTPASPPALTLQLTQAPGSESTTTLLLHAAGRAPASADLISADGSHDLHVTALSPTACRGDTIHYTGLGGDPWCLRVTGVASAIAATGTLPEAGSSAEVSLTLNVRNPWFPIPAIVTLAGLAVALLLLYLTATALPTWLAGALLDWYVQHPGDIRGLDAWRQASAPHLSKADQLARVTWMKRYGVKIVTASRAKLATELAAAGTTVLAGSPLRAAASAEIGRAGADAEEMVGVDGKIAVSPAEQLATLVARAHKDITDWRQQIAHLRDQLDPAHHEPADALIAQTEAMFATLSPSMIDYIETAMRAVLEQIAQYARQAAGGQVHAVVAAAMTAAATAPPAPAAIPAAVSAGVAGPLASFARVAAVGFATFGLVVVLMAIAAATALSASYFPNTTFGSVTDYLSLFTGAFASSSVAGILGVALAWMKASSWRG